MESPLSSPRVCHNLPWSPCICSTFHSYLCKSFYQHSLDLDIYAQQPARV